MKIILYKDVSSLGEEGDVKVVADGYARNYLIPRGFAVRYSRATETELAQKQQAILRRKDEKVRAAAGDRIRIEGLTMHASVAAGDSGRLFGSVTATAVVDYLRTQGVTVERKRVEMPEGGIKSVGNHSVKVKLYGGEEAMLSVAVAASGEKPAESEAPPEPRIDPVQDDEDMDDGEYLNRIAAEDMAADTAADSEETSDNSETES